MSPYPVVVMVTMLHHIAWGIELNVVAVASAVSSTSAKYASVAEIVRTVKSAMR